MLLTLHVYPRGPEDDSYNSILCTKTPVFLTDTLYFICIDKHIGMTNVKFNVVYVVFSGVMSNVQF
jgi:hypothetical protein